MTVVDEGQVPVRSDPAGEESAGLPVRVRLAMLLGLAICIAVILWAAGGFRWFASGPPCPSGRVCSSEAGISLVLAPGWVQMSPQHADELFVAALDGSTSGPGIMLRRARDVLGVEPTDIERLDAAANEARTGVPGELSFVWSSGSSRVTTPIGPAVRINFRDTSGIFVQYDCVDHWFFANGQPWVLTYARRDDYRPGYGGSDLQAMIDSLEFLAPTI